MTSSPREKDAWMDALQKVLSEKFVDVEHSSPPVVAEQKKDGTNLERSDSKRSEVKSAPILDTDTSSSAFTRSFSAGPSIGNKQANRSAGSSPIPEKDTQNKVAID